MQALLMFALICVIVEASLQYGWVGWYFRSGIPVCRFQVPSALSVKNISNGGYSFRFEDNGHAMIRQHGYVISRYSTHHGYITIKNGHEESTCTIYGDYHIFSLGALISCVIFGIGFIQIVGGIILSWLLIRLIIIFSNAQSQIFRLADKSIKVSQ